MVVEGRTYTLLGATRSAIDLAASDSHNGKRLLKLSDRLYTVIFV